MMREMNCLLLCHDAMEKALRKGDTLARIGGDEFIAVMVDLENVGDNERVLKRLLKAAAARRLLWEAHL